MQRSVISLNPVMNTRQCLQKLEMQYYIAKLVGMLIDSDLSFSDHVKSYIRKRHKSFHQSPK